MENIKNTCKQSFEIITIIISTTSNSLVSILLNIHIQVFWWLSDSSAPCFTFSYRSWLWYDNRGCARFGTVTIGYQDIRTCLRWIRFVSSFRSITNMYTIATVCMTIDVNTLTTVTFDSNYVSWLPVAAGLLWVSFH